MKNIYCVKVWFDDDIENIQKRYVAAESVEEVTEKMVAYAQGLQKSGFGALHFFRDAYKLELINIVE